MAPVKTGLAGGAGGAHIRARHNVHAIGRCCDRKLRFCVARHIKVAGARYEVRRGDLDDKRRGTGFRWIAADGNFCVGIIRLADALAQVGGEIGDPVTGERGFKGVVRQRDNHIFVSDRRAGRAVDGHIGHGRRRRGGLMHELEDGFAAAVVFAVIIFIGLIVGSRFFFVPEVIDSLPPIILPD